MEGLNRPKYTKSEVSQKFNLKKLLGYSPTEQQKEAFLELVLDTIVDRTTSGSDINGNQFTQYSEQYAERKGVSLNAVDLVLEGDMLNSIEKEAQKNVVKIKMKPGVETLKAYNHNIGDTLPIRTFFGVTREDEISQIIGLIDNLGPESRQREEDQAEEAAPARQTMADLRRAIEEEIGIDFEGF
jgi:hypothetical protein